MNVATVKVNVLKNTVQAIFLIVAITSHLFNCGYEFFFIIHNIYLLNILYSLNIDWFKSMLPQNAFFFYSHFIQILPFYFAIYCNKLEYATSLEYATNAEYARSRKTYKFGICYISPDRLISNMLQIQIVFLRLLVFPSIFLVFIYPYRFTAPVVPVVASYTYFSCGFSITTKTSCRGFYGRIYSI